MVSLKKIGDKALENLYWNNHNKVVYLIDKKETKSGQLLLRKVRWSASYNTIMFEGFIPVMEQILSEAFNDLVALEDHNPDINYFPPPNNDLHIFDWQEAIYYISLDGLGDTGAFETEIQNNDRKNYFFQFYTTDLRNPNLFNHSCNE